MRILSIAPAGITHPFGDERTVMQAFPAGVSTEDADPFLMCDRYARVSTGVAKHDDFPVDWHPHRGMDILTYMKSGVGRHADSLGNRCTFATPGMQWVSCGSGIEHAEDGATPEGTVRAGFQIWVNVPASRKMDDPRYGTVPPDELPLLELAPGARARLLAGALGERQGPFATVQPVQMIDFELAANASLVHDIPDGHTTCMLFVYAGAATVSGQLVDNEHVARFDATADSRGSANCDRTRALACADATLTRCATEAPRPAQSSCARRGGGRRRCSSRAAACRSPSLGTGPS